MSSIGKKSYENLNPNLKEINLSENVPSLKDNKTTKLDKKYAIDTRTFIE